MPNLDNGDLDFSVFSPRLHHPHRVRHPRADPVPVLALLVRDAGGGPGACSRTTSRRAAACSRPATRTPSRSQRSSGSNHTNEDDDMKTTLCTSVTLTLALAAGRLPQAAAGIAAGRGARIGGVDRRRRGARRRPLKRPPAPAAAAAAPSAPATPGAPIGTTGLKECAAGGHDRRRRGRQQPEHAGGQPRRLLVHVPRQEGDDHRAGGGRRRRHVRDERGRQELAVRGPLPRQDRHRRAAVRRHGHELRRSEGDLRRVEVRRASRSGRRRARTRRPRCA